MLKFKSKFFQHIKYARSDTSRSSISSLNSSNSSHVYYGDTTESLLNSMSFLHRDSLLSTANFSLYTRTLKKLSSLKNKVRGKLSGEEVEQSCKFPIMIDNELKKINLYTHALDHDKAKYQSTDHKIIDISSPITIEWDDNGNMLTSIPINPEAFDKFISRQDFAILQSLALVDIDNKTLTISSDKSSSQALSILESQDMVITSTILKSLEEKSKKKQMLDLHGRINTRTLLNSAIPYFQPYSKPAQTLIRKSEGAKKIIEFILSDPSDENTINANQFEEKTFRAASKLREKINKKYSHIRPENLPENIKSEILSIAQNVAITEQTCFTKPCKTWKNYCKDRHRTGILHNFKRKMMDSKEMKNFSNEQNIKNLDKELDKILDTNSEEFNSLLTNCIAQLIDNEIDPHTLSEDDFLKILDTYANDYIKENFPNGICQIIKSKEFFEPTQESKLKERRLHDMGLGGQVRG